MPIFYIMYEAEPKPEAEDFGESGGAYITCWVKATSTIEARTISMAAIQQSSWKVLSIEDDCREVNEESYLGNEESLEYYRQAVLDGECYIYHQWPNEPQEDDAVH